ncbi:MAG: ATP-dependent RecD-like DNA helicase, partial [Desulfobacterales bacterium]
MQNSRLTALEGQLEHITYSNAATRYTVARLRPRHSPQLVTVIGFLAGVSPGQTLKLEGTWETHPKYGQQFRIQSYDIRLPASVDGIRQYLGSGMIKGIGPQMADRLVRRFGADTLAIIEGQPEKMQEVEGIGPAKAALIGRSWKEHHAARELMAFLQARGVKASYGALILREYGSEALRIIRGEPYRLVRDLGGSGFQVADAIARDLGFDDAHPDRSRAGILYLLQQFAEEGHTFAPEDHLLARAENLLQIDSQAAQSAIAALVGAGDIA